MGEPWASIAARLRQQRLLAPKSLHQQLLDLENPFEVLDAASALNISSGMLSAEQLQEMIAYAGQSGQNALPAKEPVVAQAPTDLARSIAPINEPEPIDIHLRNNLPDWNQADFSMNASDTPSDITVHFDITG
ncbi:MAG: hypothetical protein ACPGMW_01600, partial [Poseidonia sp.]